MSAACAPARTAVYRRRRPERTVLYRTVQTHLATWLERSCNSRQGASGPAHVEREFRRHLECGILAHGFARARCTECGHDFLIAWSCKGRGVCPACHTRRMVETAAPLADPVFPRRPVRQWVLSVPKRLRDHLQHDPTIETLALRIFLSIVEQVLRHACPVAGPDSRIGAMAFIYPVLGRCLIRRCTATASSSRASSRRLLQEGRRFTKAVPPTRGGSTKSTPRSAAVCGAR